MQLRANNPNIMEELPQPVGSFNNKTINAAISAQINETRLLKFKLPSVHATTKLIQQKLYIFAGMYGCEHGNFLFDNQHQWLLK